MIEKKLTGVYNANGLPGRVTMQDVLEEAKVTSGSDATFTWVEENFLLEEKVAAWSEMPFWLPEEAAPHLKGFMFVNTDKAVGAGLVFRSLSQTIRDTLTWHQTNQTEAKLKAGIDRDRERDLLQKFHAQQRVVA
jgi:2'-hydroxyisoflavone reductase